MEKLIECWIWGKKACNFFDEIQFSSVAQPCPTLRDPMGCSTPGFPVHHQLLEKLKLMLLESVMPSNHLILCRPLLLPPSIFRSIRVFSNESVLPIRLYLLYSPAENKPLCIVRDKFFIRGRRHSDF